MNTWIINPYIFTFNFLTMMNTKKVLWALMPFALALSGMLMSWTSATPSNQAELRWIGELNTPSNCDQVECSLTEGDPCQLSDDDGVYQDAQCQIPETMARFKPNN